MKAIQQLKNEHESIKIMLNIMEKILNDLGKGQDLNKIHYTKIIEFLKVFVDKCHHGKEEDILFPTMIDHGIPKGSTSITAMLIEHQLGRGHIKLLSSTFEEFTSGNKHTINNIITSSMSYVEHLRNHIERENNIVFMMADKILNETEQSKIYDTFEIYEIEKIGIGKHDEYHHLLDRLKSIYLH